MGTAKKTTAVAVKSESLPAVVHDYGTDAGSGFEGTTGKDLAIPFLAVLQANSPQVIESNPPGAKAGDIYNTVTREIYDGKKGVPFQPAFVEHKVVEWVPRDNGGGFVGSFDPEAQVVKDAIIANGGKAFGKLKAVSSGNELVETYYVFGNVLSADGGEVDGFAIAAFTSTKIKKYRAWNTSMQSIKGRPPLFANRAILKTVLEKNKAGQPYFNLQVEPLSGTSWKDSLIPPNSALIEAAKGLREMVASGAARASYETQNSVGHEPEEAASAAPGGNATKAPF